MGRKWKITTDQFLKEKAKQKSWYIIHQGTSLKVITLICMFKVMNAGIGEIFSIDNSIESDSDDGGENKTIIKLRMSALCETIDSRVFHSLILLW